MLIQILSHFMKNVQANRMTNFGPLCEKLITGIVINTKQPLFLWLSSRPALGSIINELLTVQVQKMESDYGSRWLDAPAYYIMLLVVISQNAFIFNFYGTTYNPIQQKFRASKYNHETISIIIITIKMFIFRHK